MAQEYCQMLSWIYVAKSSTLCSAENQLSGLGFVACAGVVTTCFCMCAYFISDKANQPGRIGRARIILAFAAVSWVGYLLRMWGYFLGAGSTNCMYPGQCGHLTRRPESGIPLSVEVNYALTYCLPLFGLLITARGADGRFLNWSVSGPGLIGICSLLAVYADFRLLRNCSKGEEATVWCWFCSCLCLWFWFEVRLYTWLVDPHWAPTQRKGQDSRARLDPSEYKG
eukprot:CAMPEP_0180830760 /NCGR_PEP_ID=MMETSP1038_2-20121128/75984_1 /TAXON_ID=632150 /ORGANISM="Azadinium spinosum, Strain 3D9" /LENGTH=225 /DNA_ID=CAMNT_0022873927 /DNA_START=142 /DNA_END=816 /DNA_ORIENTATION=-